MRTPQEQLQERFRAAGVDGGQVQPSQDAKFGDYQSNAAMILAKAAKTNPRAMATSILEKVDLNDLCDPPEIAGPGFINLRLKPDWLADRLTEIAHDPRQGVDA